MYEGLIDSEPFVLHATFMSYSDVANPLVRMLKFCIKSITSAMLSASLNFGLIASKRNCGKLNTRCPVESEFSIFGIVLQRLLS